MVGRSILPASRKSMNLISGIMYLSFLARETRGIVNSSSWGELTRERSESTHRPVGSSNVRGQQLAREVRQTDRASRAGAQALTPAGSRERTEYFRTIHDRFASQWRDMIRTLMKRKANNVGLLGQLPQSTKQLPRKSGLAYHWQCESELNFALVRAKFIR